MALTLTQAEREIELFTPLGTDVLLLQGFTIEEELGRLYTINAECASVEDIVYADLLGQNVSIRLNLPSGGTRFFNGHVSRISQATSDGAYARYNVTIHPWLWFLTRTSDCRIFQQLSVPDIIKQVCNELGYTDIVLDLTESYRIWEYCVQYRETDFNFLSRLMEQEGIYFYFSQEEGKNTLILADGPGSHSPIPGYEELTFHPPDSTVVRDADKFISKWSCNNNFQSCAYVLNDYDFVLPNADLKVDSTVPRQHIEAELEMYDYSYDFKNKSDGEAYVRTRIEELSAQYLQGQGHGEARGLVCGGLFTLTNLPREDQNCEYNVVSVRHSIHIADFFATGGGGTDYKNSFNVIESSRPFRSARITPKPIVQGPQTAVVVGPSGEEIYTNEHGQVKLQFHWDRYGESNENSSCWVRVSQLWAGKTWGGIHIPRIGQEVIVEFLEGDPDQPIVTGRVYNGEQTPPYALPANKTQSGIKSRSSKGGSGANFNEIRFEDLKGEEQVYIHAEKNQDNIVENDETTSVGHDRTEDVGNDETISIGNNRTETVGNDETITIGNNRTEQVAVNETISIGSNRSVTIGSNKTETIAINKAETIGVAKALTIGGAYQVSVGAAMNETIGGAKAEQIGATKSVSVGGSSSEGVGGSKSVSAGGNLLEFAGKDVSITAGKDVIISSAENMSVAAKGDFSLQGGKNGSIDIADELTVKCGKATISMKKNGDITINGKKISIKGSGDVVIKGSKILQN